MELAQNASEKAGSAAKNNPFKRGWFKFDIT